MTLLRADIDNKRADTGLKVEQLRWEPVKAMAAAFCAGVAVTVALGGALTWLVAHLMRVAP